MTDIVARLRNAVRTTICRSIRSTPSAKRPPTRSSGGSKCSRKATFGLQGNWRWRPWRTCGPAANSEAMVARNRRSRSRSSNSVSNGRAQRNRGRLIGLSVWQTKRVGF